MVSIRRRKLLGLCSGRSLFLSPIPHVSENGQILQNHVEKATSVSVHPLPLSDDYAPKDGTSLEQDPAGSSNAGLFQQFPEIKRRKRHKRKHVENQEPCIMRGVYFKNSKWQAAIKVDKKQIHLGTVGSQEEAARLYDRAAFMCGRAPNFELSEEEKRQLGSYKWDEFLEFTRSSITSKKIQKRMASGLQRKRRNEEWDGEQPHSSISASEDDTSAL